MDKDITIITLSGKAGVGKDYIAKKLWSKIDYSQNITPKVMAYGDSLRDELTVIGWEIEHKSTNYPYSAEYVNRAIARKYKLPINVVDYLEKNKVYNVDFYSETKDPNYRKFMQGYGTDVRRKQDSDYWVNIMVTNILDYAESCNDGTIIIIPDARFTNEITVLRDLFNHVYAYQLIDDNKAIDTRESKRDTRSMTKKERKHVSETSLDNFTGFDSIFNRSKDTTKDIVDSIASQVINNKHVVKGQSSG